MQSIIRITAATVLLGLVPLAALAQPGDQTILWAGLEHTPLGDASLTITADDQLVVANLGNSGLDGVSTALPAGTPGECFIAEVHTGGAGEVTFELRGSIDGVVGTIGSNTYTEIPGGSLQMAVDFSPLGSTTQLVQIWNGSTLMAEFPGQTGGPIEMAVPSSGRYEGYVRPDPDDMAVQLFSVAFKIPIAVPIPAGPDGDEFLGDRVVITPEGATATVDDLQGVVVLCSGVDSLIVSNVVLFGFPVAVDDGALPKAALLRQNAPNPFNPSTLIAFDLPQRGRIDLGIYDVRGALVRNLASGVFEAGPHQRVWRGKDDLGRQMPAGVYFYRLATDEGELTKRMTMVK